MTAGRSGCIARRASGSRVSMPVEVEREPSGSDSRSAMSPPAGSQSTSSARRATARRSASRRWWSGRALGGVERDRAHAACPSARVSRLRCRGSLPTDVPLTRRVSRGRPRCRRRPAPTRARTVAGAGRATPMTSSGSAIGSHRRGVRARRCPCRGLDCTMSPAVELRRRALAWAGRADGESQPARRGSGRRGVEHPRVEQRAGGHAGRGHRCRRRRARCWPARCWSTAGQPHGRRESSPDTLSPGWIV